MEIDRRWPEGIYVRELPSVGGKVYSQVVASSGSRRIDVAGTLPFDENQTGRSSRWFWGTRSSAGFAGAGRG